MAFLICFTQQPYDGHDNREDEAEAEAFFGNFQPYHTQAHALTQAFFSEAEHKSFASFQDAITYFIIWQNHVTHCTLVLTSLRGAAWPSSLTVAFKGGIYQSGPPLLQSRPGKKVCLVIILDTPPNFQWP